MFLPAVALAAWFGGLSAAIVTIGLSAGLAEYFLIPPLHVLSLDGWLDIAAFALVALFISILIARLVRAERADQHLAAIVEGSDDAIIGSDLNGIITAWNAGAEYMYGYRADEMIGQPCSKLSAPHGPDENADILARIRQGERVRHFVTQRRRKDGTIIDISLTVSPIYDRAGRVVGCSRIARDVTGPRRAEEARRESDARFRSLFENMLNGFAYCQMVFDQDRPVDFVPLDVNPAFETLLGLKNVVGKKISTVLPGIRESDPALLEIFGRVARTRQPEQREIEVKALDKWLSISAYSPLPENFVVVFDVITERKLAEARSQEMNRELEQRVAGRTQELETAMHQLEYAGQARSRMLSNVSHEMRTPLSSIIGFSGLMLHRELLAETQHRYLDAIHAEGRRLLSLINDFLDLQHFATRPENLRLEPFDLAALIRDLIRPYTSEQYRRWPMVLDVPESLPVTADKDRIQQLIVNLLSNAIKYSPDGGEILISVCDQDHAVYFTIQDHGLGIPAQEMHKLFEPFHRGEMAEHLRMLGTGMGLALCREIVEAHHGTIWAESGGSQQGTTFTFVLPNRTPAAPETDHAVVVS